jgi:glycogen(starch) synthase
MNILLCSVPFAPSVGGIESVTALLARQWHDRGHGVTIVTMTAGLDGAAHDVGVDGCAVLRRPRAGALMQAVRNADVIVHNQISLRLAWPLLLLKRPWFVVHHTWIDGHGAGPLTVAAKHLVLHGARNLAVSKALARSLAVPCTCVPNPFDDAVFRRIDGVERNRDFVFVGRLVSDKGAALLVQALARMKLRGLHATTTIVGHGPEERRLRGLVRQARLDSDVIFAGRQQGDSLARTLNAHRFAVVPSLDRKSVV